MARKEYTKDQLTVVWQPDLCIHSAICAQGLPQVFDPDRRPWVDLSKAETEAIIAQVKKCPSGALSVKEAPEADTPSQVKVQLMTGGPLILKGSCEVIDEEGQTTVSKNTAFCRCTKSQNFPYCDGSHNR